MAKDGCHNSIQLISVIIQVWNGLPNERAQRFWNLCFVQDDRYDLGLTRDSINNGRIKFLPHPWFGDTYRGDHNQDRFGFLKAFLEKLIDQTISRQYLPFVEPDIDSLHT